MERPMRWASVPVRLSSNGKINFSGASKHFNVTLVLVNKIIRNADGYDDAGVAVRIRT